MEPELIGDWWVEECQKCCGSGFSGHGSGYDAVCGECGGTSYLPLEKANQVMLDRSDV